MKERNRRRTYREKKRTLKEKKQWRENKSFRGFEEEGKGRYKELNIELPL